MYLLGEQPAYADKLISRLQAMPATLLAGLEPSGPPLVVEESDDLSLSLPGNQLFLIKQGLVNGLIDERPLFYMQEGDLLGLRQGG